MNKTTLNSQKEKHSIANFYPRSPCGERHLRMSLLFVCKNFYPRSPCGERRTGPVGGHIPDRISIHALLAESDVSSRKLPSSWRRFLSTLSLRRATYPAASCRPRGGDFYPRSPCGERRIQPQAAVLVAAISIHALLAESDPRIGCEKAGNQNFYPRSPCGERQYIPFTALMASAYFYPRSPCGERRTPNLYTTKCTDISIHALLAESDGASFVMSLFYINFYPRSPCGERHFKKEILP